MLYLIVAYLQATYNTLYLKSFSPKGGLLLVLFLLLIGFVCLSVLIYFSISKLPFLKPVQLNELLGKRVKVTQSIGPHPFNVGSVRIYTDSVPAISANNEILHPGDWGYIKEFQGLFAVISTTHK